jgi:Mg2+ and Co2+ transporter CorA
VDYSSNNVQITQYDNQGLIDFLQESRGLSESWAKVRWINVGGISWDVLSALTIKYDLHPLSLENILHGRRTSRSKADYYQQHMFLHILCHSLQEDDASPLEAALARAKPTTAPGPEKNDLEAAPVPAAARRGKGKPKTQEESRNDTERRIKAADEAVGVLKGRNRVQVKISSLYLFLTRDGTLISIHSTDRGFGNPILGRLKQRGTLLRTTSDASQLLQALVDLVVDRAMDIVDQYHEELLKIERQVLIKPKMNTVKALHVISEDLTLHRRTLEPLKTLIYGLRRYDTDRAAAMAESLGEAARPGDSSGYLTHKSKIYLADVHDHVEFILASFERFESIAENMINFTFNTLSYEMNEAMKMLTIATIIFLPPTFVTGYFGQNWSEQPLIVYGNSDIIYWIITLPFTAVIIAVFLWKDIWRAIHWMHKRLFTRRIQEEY